MIPAFLHSMSTQVRALVTSGKALHVTNQTADELELLAGLFETKPATCMIPLDYSQSGCVSIPAGTLRNRDRITMLIFDGDATAAVERDITPADIAWAWLGLAYAEHAPDQQCFVRGAECAELAAIAVRRGIDPYNGTREGARAAWGHVVACTQGQAIADRYRRELEAL